MATKPAINNTQKVLDTARAVLEQTKAEGSKAFKGSSYDTSRNKKTPPLKTPPPTKNTPPPTTPPDNTRYPRSGGTKTPAPVGLGNGAENDARGVLYDLEPFNEDQRRQELLRGKREQISSLDRVYDDKVAEERKYGEKDLARSNTISAMTGMSGGYDATTRAGGAERRTKERVDTVNNARALALQGIYSEVDNLVSKEKESRLATQRANAENVLKEIAVSAQAALSKFAGQGISFNELATADPETYETLLRQSGKDAFSMRTLYEQSMPPEKRPQEIFSGWKGNNYVTIRRNADGTMTTDTYDQKELGIPDEFVDPKSITIGDQVFWYDSEKPLGEDGKPKLIPVGQRANTGKIGSGTTGGGSTVVDEGGGVMSYNDWKRSDEAKQILEDRRKQELATTGKSAMTTGMADMMLRPIYEEGLKSYKKSSAMKGKNYTATNVPPAIKEDLMADIKSAATLADLYEAYPDVSTSYVSSLYNSLKPKKKAAEETTMTDEEFLKAISGGQ